MAIARSRVIAAGGTEAFGVDDDAHAGAVSSSMTAAARATRTLPAGVRRRVGPEDRRQDLVPVAEVQLVHLGTSIAARGHQMPPRSRTLGIDVAHRGRGP